MKKNILILRRSQPLTEATARELKQMQSAWCVRPATSMSHARSLFLGGGFDALLVDSQLPDGDGLSLLDEAMASQPGMLRFLCVDSADQQKLLACLGSGHHLLAPPVQARQLSAALERAFSLEMWATSENVKRLMWHLHRVPSPPTTYFRVVKQLGSPDVCLGDVAEEISQDPAMSGKLLQLANSAAFALREPVTSVSQAVLYLGMDLTKSLLLLAHSFSYFDQTQSQFSVEALWRHSLRTGLAARNVATLETEDRQETETAYTAGLLHDLGKLVLAANFPREYGEAVARARTTGRALWEVESEIYGATHADVGATLLSIWQLPLPIVEAVALHHHPAQFLSRGFCALTAVHVANAFDEAEHPEPQCALVPAYLEQLGLEQRLPYWQESTRYLYSNAAAA